MYLNPSFKFLLKPNLVITAKNLLEILADSLSTIKLHCESSSLETELTALLLQNNGNDVQRDDLIDFLNSQYVENASLLPKNIVR